MKKMIYRLTAGLMVLALFCPAQELKTPEEFLGFKVGADRKLADMHQIIDYFNLLAASSERVAVREVGKTTLGNPFIFAVITSADNMKRLDTYRQGQAYLADPRLITEQKAEEIIRDGKTVVMINCSLHASEIGASQMSMKLAYDLASKDDFETREILNNVILLLVPMHNPDGIQMVVDWYRKYVGTDYEGCRMPWLYHKYVGHDNNRDWYMFTQVESRLTINGIHNVWHPQIVVDMHQMGSSGARIFVPPYVDPYEPNIDPILQQQVAVMGTFIAAEMTAEGKGGVMHSIWFDAWTPARAYHHYHGGIRILTEVASARMATPINIPFERLQSEARQRSVKMAMPWKGGEWSLGDIVDYDYSAAAAVLTNAARLRENWLRNFYRIHKKAVTRTEPPFAFLVPRDQEDLSTALKMLRILRIGAVEVHRAEEPFQAGGKQYEAGTYIIYMAQPYGGFAKTLLENQVYPEIREYPGGPLKTPYDVVAHTLPLLMGVDVVRVDRLFVVENEEVKELNKPQGIVEVGDSLFGYAWGHTNNDDIVALNRILSKGYSVSWAAVSFTESGRFYPAGTMIVKRQAGLDDLLASITRDLYVRFQAVKLEPEVKQVELKPVRLGLYKSWTASMDEGWTRWVLEQYEFPYSSIYDEDIRKGGLEEKLDVLIIPDLRDGAIMRGLSSERVPPEYAGGIGETGLEHLKDFVRGGGSVITLNGAADFAVKRFELKAKDVTEGLPRKEFFIPGSILRAEVDNTHPVAFGYENEEAVFFRRSPVFEAAEGRSVLTYPSSDILISGWINGEKVLAGRSGIVDAPFGQGRVIILGFPVQYRGQAHNTFRFLFNAVYYGASEMR